MGVVLGILLGGLAAEEMKKVTKAAIEAARKAAIFLAKKAKKAAAEAAASAAGAMVGFAGLVAEAASKAAAEVFEKAGSAIGDALKQAAEAAGKKAAEEAIAAGKGFKEAAEAAAKAIEEYIKRFLLGEITDVAAEAAAEATAVSCANAITMRNSTYSSKSSKIKDLTGLEDLKQFLKGFGETKTVFVGAKAMISSNGESMDVRLNKYVCVLDEMDKKMNNILDWLKKNEEETVELEKDYAKYNDLVTVMAPLIAGMGNLKRISIDVKDKTNEKPSMTAAQVDSLEWCLDKVYTTFELLADYMNDMRDMRRFEGTDPDFTLFPFEISRNQVSKWRNYLLN